MADEKAVFVTVGTTSFDHLIEKISSKPLVEVSDYFFFVSRLQISNCVSSSPQLFEKLGYHSIILQIGRGVYEPEIIDRKGFSMKYYRYKDSIAGDIQRASLVISHAGKVNFQMLSN